MAVMNLTMPSAACQMPDLDQRVVLRGIGWHGYETILALIGDHSSLRLTFDRMDLELMSPSLAHEEFGSLLERIVQTVTEELRIPCRCAGSTTWRVEGAARGLEADACFFIGSFSRIRGRRKSIDLNVDPPPDLAIEVEMSRSALDRMSIYASLGVPEVWRFDGTTLVIEKLQADGSYQPSDKSPSLPMLAPAEIVEWVNQGRAIDDNSEWVRQFREWVRRVLIPRHETGSH